MTFEDILDQALAMLQRRGRVTYGTMQQQFALDAVALETLKDALLFSHPQIVDENGRGLVWTGDAATTVPQSPEVAPPPSHLPPPDAERRQLTVLFCDLVDSTVLASQLDPEDLREVVRAYQAICAEVIQHFDGTIAQYLGDGLLVYFGYPVAHEDEARRAVHAGLGMLEALKQLNQRLEQDRGITLGARLGIHTGLVVVGEMGGQGRQEQLALGEVPNVAARLQGVASPNTMVISAATHRLVQGLFTCHDLGLHSLRGLSVPLQVYRVLGESGAQSRFEVTSAQGLTTLVGREKEVGLLLERWMQVKQGVGQVVLLGGEAGLGKSRLVQVVKDRVARESCMRLECRCSPYYQHTALYPVIDLWQRSLEWRREDSPLEKLHKLEAALTPYDVPLPEIVPLLAALLLLPLPADRYAPLTLTPQRQRVRTLEAVLAVFRCMATRQPLLLILEDLHWADPTTLELLGLLLAQAPSTRLLILLVFRSEFRPPWDIREHHTHMTLTPLAHDHTVAMITQVAEGKRLPVSVLEQLVTNTDGNPLFVEELTKMVLESGLLREAEDHYELVGDLPGLTIPTTLHDSLLARLDRLGSAKAVAQLGATLGRAFPYELLHAVSPVDTVTLKGALTRLVEAGLLYQQDAPPQAIYLFKHALIQEAAHQSLLRSTRQQYHQRIAQVLEAQFPETCEIQPELLAQHYAEAGLREQAIAYRQRAGQQALQRSANPEAVQHLTKSLELLATLPETPARAQQELDLQLALGPALGATKGSAAPEVEQTYIRARALCAQIGETPQLFRTLRGLCRFYTSRGALPMAREPGEQLLRLAQRQDAPTLRLEAHEALGNLLFYLGEYAAARPHLEQGIVLTDPALQRALALRHGIAPGVTCLGIAAHTLWCLGYPVQAVRRSQEALALAQALAHPPSLAIARHWAAWLHQRRRDVPVVREQADALLLLATAQEFPTWVGSGRVWQGWVLAVSGQGGAGLAQMRQGLAAVWATRAALWRPFGLVALAEAAGHVGQVAEGLRLLAEALESLEANAQGDMLAEAHRLQGALLLHQATPDAIQAEVCFQQALAIARRQQAKSWELRAATSLARLWQQQGKRAEARELLAPVYGWFTEGFDTADLQEAQALLEAVA
jgi:class 3 adenylate cyclase/predicted ATPase